jgi:hypothetical protein
MGVALDIETRAALEIRMRTAEQRYGDLASTHEGLGVALEEWNELQDAIRANDTEQVAVECLDLAAVLIRMACLCKASEVFKRRSQK